jgi:superfamily II DNA or RNA helicase
MTTDRDIAPLDRLLGDMLSTTTRMMLVAPTGLGKTNIALAIRVDRPRPRLLALARARHHQRSGG